MPLPHSTFTIAEAVKSIKSLNYATAHFGKWHLGDFWNKTGTPWDTSNPSDHGFDYWMSTEASAPSCLVFCPFFIFYFLFFIFFSFMPKANVEIKITSNHRCFLP